VVVYWASQRSCCMPEVLLALRNDTAAMHTWPSQSVVMTV
jgi:hypothetical protein